MFPLVTLSEKVTNGKGKGSAFRHVKIQTVFVSEQLLALSEKVTNGKGKGSAFTDQSGLTKGKSISVSVNSRDSRPWINSSASPLKK